MKFSSLCVYMYKVSLQIIMKFFNIIKKLLVLSLLLIIVYKLVYVQFFTLIWNLYFKCPFFLLYLQVFI